MDLATHAEIERVLAWHNTHRSGRSRAEFLKLDPGLTPDEVARVMAELAHRVATTARARSGQRQDLLAAIDVYQASLFAEALRHTTRLDDRRSAQ